jgi:hypothetical protein
VVLWRDGLRINEALAPNEPDLDHRRGSLLVRRDKGGRRREVGMDEWGWEQLRLWLFSRHELPVGPLFCVISGRTRDGSSPARPRARRFAGPPRRPAYGAASGPHQLRHATRSRWRTRRGSNANSVTATSASLDVPPRDRSPRSSNRPRPPRASDSGPPRSARRYGSDGTARVLRLAPLIGQGRRALRSPASGRAGRAARS